MTPSEQARAVERAERFARMKCACGAPVKSTRHRNCDACRKEKQRELMRRSNDRRLARRKANAPKPVCEMCGDPVTALKTYCAPCLRERQKAYQKQWWQRNGSVHMHTPAGVEWDAASIAEDIAALDAQFPWLVGCERSLA